VLPGVVGWKPRKELPGHPRPLVRDKGPLNESTKVRLAAQANADGVPLKMELKDFFKTVGRCNEECRQAWLAAHF
jgi:hypothetical protein